MLSFPIDVKLHSDPRSRREQGQGVYISRIPCSLRGQLKCPNPYREWAINRSRNFWGDGVGCLGRVAKESVSGNVLETTSAVLYKAQQGELTPACLFKA